MTPENRSNQTNENDSLRKWQDIIPRLPSGFQEQAKRLPESCQRNVVLLAEKCDQLVVEFPPSPCTPYDLASVSRELKLRTSGVVQALIGWGDRPFKNIWLRKLGLLKQATEKSVRKELAVALSELISQDASKRFASANPASPLVDYCLEAVGSFVSVNIDSAIVGGRLSLEKNFMDLPLLPVYCLGAYFVDIENYGKEEFLIAIFPHRIREGEIGPLLFGVPLKEIAPY